MVRWHHQLNKYGFEQTLGDGEGQGSLVCCSPWGHKASDTTEPLNNNNMRTGVGLTCSPAHIGEGDGTPLQYSCLENPMARGAWWAAVHGVAKNRTRLSDSAAANAYKLPSGAVSGKQ